MTSPTRCPEWPRHEYGQHRTTDLERVSRAAELSACDVRGGCFHSTVPRPVAIADSSLRGRAQSHWALTVGYVVGWGFVVGSAAILFAGEKESKTYGLLQQLPLRWFEMAIAKFASLLCGTVLIFASLGITGCLIALSARATFAEMQGNSAATRADAILTFAIPFLIATGVLAFSVLLNDVLLAIVFGVAVPIAGLLWGDRLRPIQDWPQWLMPALCLCASAIDIYLVAHWLRGIPTDRWREWRLELKWRRTSRRTATFAAETMRSPIEWRRSASSHVWKEWRQARFLGFLVFGAAAVFFLLGDLQGRLENGRSFLAALAGMFGMAIPGITGVASFREDRYGRAYRLLANHGVSPDGFWWIKQLVWLGTTVAGISIVIAVNDLVFIPLLVGNAPEVGILEFGLRPAGSPRELLKIVIYVLLLFSIGQLASLLIPRTIAAAFATLIVLAGLLWIWTSLARYQIPIWWNIGLCPFIFFAASWLRVGDWLQMRDTLRAWSKIVAALAIPAACLFVAVIIFRVIQIPFAPTEAMSSAAEESLPTRAGGGDHTILWSPGPDGARAFVWAVRPPIGDPLLLKLLQVEAWADSYNSEVPANGWGAAKDWEQRWVEDNQGSVRKVLEDARRPPSSRSFPPRPREELRRLLLYSARRFEAQDKLGEALACYLATIRMQNDFTAAAGVDRWASSQSTVAIDVWWTFRWAAHPKQSVGANQAGHRGVRAPCGRATHQFLDGASLGRKPLLSAGGGERSGSQVGIRQYPRRTSKRIVGKPPSGSGLPLTTRPCFLPNSFPGNEPDRCGCWTLSIWMHFQRRSGWKSSLPGMARSLDLV